MIFSGTGKVLRIGLGESDLTWSADGPVDGAVGAGCFTVADD